MFWNKGFADSIRSEKGSTLLSALMMLMFTSFLLLSSVTVLKHQMIQYRQTALSYEARTMIEMTEVLLKDDFDDDQSYPSEVRFSSGRTTVSRLTDTRFLIKAELNNQHTSQKTIELAVRPVELSTPQKTDENIDDDAVVDKPEATPEVRAVKDHQDE